MIDESREEFHSRMSIYTQVTMFIESLAMLAVLMVIYFILYVYSPYQAPMHSETYIESK